MTQKKPSSMQAMLDRAKQEAEGPAPAPAAAKPRQASREKTKLIGGHFPPAVSAQLRIIAAEDDTTIQALLSEAIDDLFTKKGKARIASL